jgi:uncharacterized membrane protein
MNAAAPTRPASPLHPIRRALLRGMAVILPPLLTIVVFLWAWNMIETYILVPCEQVVGQAIVWSLRDIKSGVPEGAVVYRDEPTGPVTRFDYKGTTYVPVGASNKYIPDEVQKAVAANPRQDRPAPVTAHAFFEHYVLVKYLRRERTVPMFLALFLLVLYLTGKFVAAGVGSYVRRAGEGLVERTPIVNTVYSAAKQITDSIFTEQEVQFNRVVAVEYPRKGMWIVAFVTGEGFRDVRDAAGEPVLSLLVPTSPMPATGFTCIVPKRDTIELNITVDQAVQYIVSCGVVVPTHQQWNKGGDLGADITRQVLEQATRAERLVKSV